MKGKITEVTHYTKSISCNTKSFISLPTIFQYTQTHSKKYCALVECVLC